MVANAPGALHIVIGDISTGRAIVAVTAANGELLASPRWLAEGEEVGFVLGNTTFRLGLFSVLACPSRSGVVLLTLQAVGSRTVEAAPRTIQRKEAQLSEDKKIELLIQSIERLGDAVFIRNGKEYDGKAAAKHLRRKWEWKRDEIRTARDFISRAASGSTESGEPYWIRFKDGRKVRSADFLLQQLGQIEGSPPERAHNR